MADALAMSPVIGISFIPCEFRVCMYHSFAGIGSLSFFFFSFMAISNAVIALTNRFVLFCAIFSFTLSGSLS